MNNTTYPATAEEYEEYCAVMESMADEAEASTPDPTPADMGREDEYEYEDAEDRYLDASWEDRHEIGCDFGDY